MTPFTLSKTACVPQKQPPANTAVCLPGADASAASTFGAGIGVFEAGAASALQAARNIAHRKTTQQPTRRVTITISHSSFLYETDFLATTRQRSLCDCPLATMTPRGRIQSPDFPHSILQFLLMSAAPWLIPAR